MDTDKGRITVIRILFIAFYAFFLLVAVNVISIPSSKLRLDWMFYILTWYFIAEFLLILKRITSSPVKLSGVFVVTFLLATIENFLSLIDIYRFGPIANRVEHLLGTIVIAYVTTKIYQVLRIDKKIATNYLFSHLVFMTTVFFGVLNEIIEYFSDSLLGSHHIGSGYDTQLDLLMNLLGAGIFTFYLITVKKSRH
ncbi:MAG: hypothetical protein PHS44_02290 [Candidatus Dojkabacteria bacterium]|nr:hypothetical protein [Candidatus Dojkabacteria bacterium]